MPNGRLLGDTTADFDLGPISVRPAMRSLETPAASVSVEPLVMRLLVTLSRRAGQLVSRDQVFDACWGRAAVGDDSLNRAVAVLRKALREIAGGAVRIETVPGSGYTLRLVAASGMHEQLSDNGDLIRDAIESGFDSWRLGSPEPDHLRLELLRQVTAEHHESHDAWGMLALLCRQAAEYADPREVGAYVAECQAAARRALELNTSQAEATVALASVTPLYGRWSQARVELTQVLDRVPGNAVALHDLAMLEMATGRVRAAKAIMDELIRRDPLAACLRYKSIYQHWSINDLARLDQVADSAIQLWPSHPAVWNARFWTLAYTGRGYASMAMLEETTRPHLLEPAMGLLRSSVTASLGDSGSLADEAARACSGAAVRGPTQAVAAMFGLGLLGRVDDLFEVAAAYYLRAGKGPVPMRRTTGEPSINDQHRRVTQVLFTPACAGMRDVRSRFLDLCARMGLTEYWESSGLAPDFLAPSA
jgi:DNA-binding winged helix-turn-helix (wHTH) protein